jgi:hypothetical protein
MNITAEKLQFALMIDAKIKSIGRLGGDDFTIFAEMADYLPAFRRCLGSFTSGASPLSMRRMAARSMKASEVGEKINHRGKRTDLQRVRTVVR